MEHGNTEPHGSLQLTCKRVDCQRVRPVIRYLRRFSVSVCFSSWRRKTKGDEGEAESHMFRVKTVNTQRSVELSLMRCDSSFSSLLIINKKINIRFSGKYPNAAITTFILYTQKQHCN